MGQAIYKLATERREEGYKAKEIGPIIDQCYDSLFGDTTKIHNLADFYHAICQTIEEINTKLGNIQLRVPSTDTLEKLFKEEHKGKETSQYLTKEEFRKIFQDAYFDTGVAGKPIDMFFFIFVVPITTLFVKQRFTSTAIPNEVFIPGVTSATVFFLSKLNKI